MISAGIVGGTGYTGVELLRILSLHPEVEVTKVTSRSDDGKRVDALYPSLRGLCNAVFSIPDVENLADCDVVFFATPNGTAMLMAEQLLARGVKVIDLSADFRLQDPKEWQHEIKPIKVKKHQRLAKSLFREGFDVINDAFFKLIFTFENTIKALFCFLAFNQKSEPS